MIYFKGRGFEIDEKIKIYKVLFEVKFELEVTETIEIDNQAIIRGHIGYVTKPLF